MMMKKIGHFMVAVMLILQYSYAAASSLSQYDLYFNINITSDRGLLNITHEKTVSTVSECSILCSMTSECISAIYDESTKNCELLNERLPLSLDVDESKNENSVSMIEEFCEQPNSSPEEDWSVCFYGRRTTVYSGLDHLYHLTMNNQMLNVYLEAHDGESRTANYSSFTIESATTNYKLWVSGYSGDAGDSMLHSDRPTNGIMFSTKDRDNDLYHESCATLYTGAWWYNKCHRSNLNGQWYEGGNTSSYATGAVWYTWKGLYYSLKTIIMRLGRL